MSTSDAQPDHRVHVVMMVGNDVSADSRVKKEALALVDGGARVTVLGVAFDGVRSFERLGDALIVRLPVNFLMRDERNRRRRMRRAWRPPLVGYRTRAEHLSRAARVRARLGEVKADSGWAIAHRGGGAGDVTYRFGVVARKVRYLLWKAVGRGVRVRAGVGHRVGDGLKLGWKGWDFVGNRITWPARWRTYLPEADDYEATFGKVLDHLAPDAVHAHDMHLIGVAVRAAGRASLRGRSMRVVYDAHEFVAGMARYGPRTPRFVKAWSNHEREYIRRADRVVTVSPALAAALTERYRLDREPTVILNTPMIEVQADEPASLRARAGLSDDTPLVVYSGGLTPARGIGLVIDAMRYLPGVHLAVVCVPSTTGAYVDTLREQAEQAGVNNQVHFVNPVHTSQVVPFLGSADVGVHPLTAGPRNHDVALPNKLFEYIHAGIPMVVTDLPSLGGFVRQWKVGEPFRAGDAADLARQVQAVLADKARYRAATHEPALLEAISWDRQADALRDLYGELLDATLELPAGRSETVAAAAETPAAPSPGAQRPYLVIGPANSAGQAWQWASAVERSLPSVHAESLMADTGDFIFRAHRVVPSEQFRTDLAWMVEFADYVLHHVTHVLFEAGRPILGQARGQLFDTDLPAFELAGIRTGLVFHGSEVRDPRLHREWYRYSPFSDPNEELTGRLQRATQMVQDAIHDFAGPRFVTTPDLLDFVENSTWLPVVVAVDELRTDRPVLERERPIVVHAPSHSALKGSAFVDAAVQELHDRGVVEYRRVQGVPHGELMAIIQDADIVVDQLLLGSYGVAACEAMAAGRVTVGHVADQVRARIPVDLPLLEATPDNLGDVIERLVAERDEAIKAGAAGVDYVQRFHDGRESARVLGGFLGVDA
ncbi:glycosyltransferase family 4 protein [Jiangella asiatica]|uniref:Glycosyltransferase n=1 Tax=Jiangella asiatica TaxID=2530372 RepID=A0A4R5DNV2_9ACTN|nr:glycosyltransferase [Jiangella asiatica]TDE15899.1 glycosyltransferase [Jiangella asiatica]